MKHLLVCSAAILAAACATPRGPGAATGALPRATAAGAPSGLEALLHGRIAGAPQECVEQRLLGGSRSLGDAIVFGDSTSEVVYLNRPPIPCPALGTGRALETRTVSDRLCRGDVVTVFDPVSGMQVGACALGEFTPYRRAR